MRKTAIHSFAWLPAWSMDKADYVARRAASFDFSHVVISMRDHASIDPAGIAKAFGAYGITPVAVGNQLPDADISSADPAIRRRGLDRHRASLALARDMGASHLGGVLYGLLGKMNAPAHPDALRYAGEQLAHLADDASLSRLSIVLEIVNRYESNLVNTVEQALELLGIIDRANAKIHLDTFHMNIEEPDPMAAMDRAMPHLAYFELDQNDRGLPDRGAIDFKPMLDKLRAANFDGIVGVEAFSSAVASPAICAGVGIWRNLFQHGDEVAAATRKVLMR